MALALKFQKKSLPFFHVLSNKNTKSKHKFMVPLEKNVCLVYTQSRMISRDVAQFGSAPVLGTGGRRFESCHPERL